LAKNFNTGHFIKVIHIEKAFELVKLQINDDNFSFKTLELEIYRAEEKIVDFNSGVFYKKYIEKDNYYNKRNKFFNINYLIPKGTYAVREFNFLSFELLILYYSLGFYIYDLVKESYNNIEQKKRNRENISTYYGGTINFENPIKSALYYQSDYVEFNNNVNNKIQEILEDNAKAVVIKLDIQDYFKSVDIEILLQIISNYSVPSNSKKSNFDLATLEEIKNLFTFINGGLIGLPLFAQNIISNFLSYIFLFDLDNYVQELPISNDKDFLYCRYVDDFYLIFKRNKGIENNEIGNEIFEITTGITDYLFSHLKLSINPLKTHQLIIEDADGFEKFVKKEKIISIPDVLKTEKKPGEKLKDIKKIIDNLKENYKNDGRAYLNTEENNKLKEIFSSSLKKYIASKPAIAIINEMFENWNPILTLSNSQALIFLIKRSHQNELLKIFLLEDKEIKFNSPQYLYLLEKYLLSNNDDEGLKEEILKSPITNTYLKLIKKMIDKSILLSKDEEIDIDDDFLDINDTAMQQIKMLVLAEMGGKFNLAFNHLLNIYHYYCFKNDPENPLELKKYVQTDVLDFIDSLRVSNEYLNFSIKFFDRRNKNNISHPGEDLLENWIVNEDEYFKYKSKLNSLLKKIKELIPPPTVDYIF